jgi:hypothetical protein
LEISAMWKIPDLRDQPLVEGTPSEGRRQGEEPLRCKDHLSIRDAAELHIGLAIFADTDDAYGVDEIELKRRGPNTITSSLRTWRPPRTRYPPGLGYHRNDEVTQ